MYVCETECVCDRDNACMCVSVIVSNGNKVSQWISFDFHGKKRY